MFSVTTAKRDRASDDGDMRTQYTTERVDADRVLFRGHAGLLLQKGAQAVRAYETDDVVTIVALSADD